MSESAPRLLNRAGIRAVLPWSDCTLWRAIRDGRFPAPSLYLGNRRLWDSAVVEEWLAAQMRDGSAEATHD